MRWQDNRWWDQHSKQRRNSTKPIKNVEKKVPVTKAAPTVSSWDFYPKDDPGLIGYVNDIVAKFSMKNYRYPMTITVTSGFLRPGCLIQLSFECAHRDTGETTGVGLSIPVTQRESEDLLCHRIREAIKTFVVHEMDECLHYGGERRWDPHKYDRVY